MIAGVLTSLVLLLASPAPGADDPVLRVTGSSTVAPFSRAVAAFAGSDRPIEVGQTGTGAGIAALCAPAGHVPAIVGASRRITRAELSRCHGSGVQSLVELTIGLDGIVLAQSQHAPELSLTARDVYLALARQTPRTATDCTMVTNRRETWRDVRSDLPKRQIRVIGPAAGSGTRDMFISLVMKRGALSHDCLRARAEQDPGSLERILALRTDDRWIDGGENDHAIAHTLTYVREALGIFGFAHLKAAEGIEALSFEGVVPDDAAIASGDYPLARPLYLYARAARLAEDQAVEDVLAAYTSLPAVGPKGYLRKLGLIVAQDAGRRVVIPTQDAGP
jgi:phosphate transport system substrate-binding protein